MIPVSLNEIRKLFGADVTEKDVVITDVTTDSRAVTAGCLFVALKGDRFDGHDFVESAIKAGAAAAVVCRSFSCDSLCGDEKKIIRVPDTLKALGKIAGLVRDKVSVPVVGITGSVGKTTSKEMIACAVSPLGDICKTKLNYNNEIGLPSTILSVKASDKALIGEMGMRGLGEIEYLTDILKPTLGVITNIGISHIERLGSKENIMKAKTEICSGLKEGGVLLCGAEDYDRAGLEGRIESFNKGIQLKFYGLDKTSAYYADDIRINERGSASFRFMPANIEVSLGVPGEHNVRNAVGALAVASEIGVDLNKAAEALGAFEGDKIRQNIILLDGGRITLIDDTYNAGPESMIASLSVLASLKAERKIAFLGTMLELGSAAAEAHKTVYDAARGICTDIFTVGEEWPRGGDFRTSADATDKAVEVCKDGDIAILVKGSHSMEMNKITEVIKNGY